MKQHILIPGILTLTAVVWLTIAVSQYGVWDEGPLGGFMPVLASIITIGFSLASIVKHTGGNKPWHVAVFIPVLIVVALVLLVPYIGMLPGMLALLLGWFRFLEKYSWTFSILISAGVILCVWLIFSLWLGVPFPAGRIAESFM